ncbi:hypothetical protein Y032_0225g2756 [Ancylostoma ceylanicum]|uniref:Uncharacterized protein n=1 Tax=Ancylostoma ceylanicum TaxID=53326 RepID=A0A016SI21_9BILA|nr:hypothetical protein Y032_0225g2756 [Ancylostoma ceylanicum]
MSDSDASESDENRYSVLRSSGTHYKHGYRDGFLCPQVLQNSLEWEAHPSHHSFKIVLRQIFAESNYSQC